MSSLSITPAERVGFYASEDTLLQLKDRLASRGPENEIDPANLTEMWVQKIHWDLQRGLLMGEDEETTGVVKLELPEL